VKTRDEINAYRRERRKLPEVRERERVLRRMLYLKDIEHSREISRNQRNRNAEDRRLRSLTWYYANKEKASTNHSAWCKANRDKINHYSKKRMNGCVKLRLFSTTKHRIWEAVRNQTGKTRNSKMFKFLGCDKQFLVKWIEKQFQLGMSWENYGQYGWHIDHKRPCASFDLTNPEHQKLCFHYTNLQPLWWRDNLSKHAKWEAA